MEKQLIMRLLKNFEEFSCSEDGVEFWYARNLQKLLGYSRWENFLTAIGKAKQACNTAKNLEADHFRDATKMVDIGSSSQRVLADIKLTRYACYLIAQNGDPRKEEIAFAQTYFAVQTRKQEIIEKRLSELERIKAREKLSRSEKELAGVLFEHGVDNPGFARIKSKGDQALFGGRNTRDMKRQLGVPEVRPLADFLPAVTISAKELANQMTKHNVNYKNLLGESPVTSEHISNNRQVRKALTNVGIHPEHLPASEDIKKVNSRLKSEGNRLPQLAKNHVTKKKNSKTKL